MNFSDQDMTLNRQDSLVSQLAYMGIDDEGKLSSSALQRPIITNASAAAPLGSTNRLNPSSSTNTLSAFSSAALLLDPQRHTHTHHHPIQDNASSCGDVTKNREEKISQLQESVEQQLSGLTGGTSGVDISNLINASSSSFSHQSTNTDTHHKSPIKISSARSDAGLQTANHIDREDDSQSNDDYDDHDNNYFGDNQDDFDEDEDYDEDDNLLFDSGFSPLLHQPFIQDNTIILPDENEGSSINDSNNAVNFTTSSSSTSEGKNVTFAPNIVLSKTPPTRTSTSPSLLFPVSPVPYSPLQSDLISQSEDILRLTSPSTLTIDTTANKIPQLSLNKPPSPRLQSKPSQQQHHHNHNHNHTNTLQATAYHHLIPKQETQEYIHQFSDPFSHSSANIQSILAPTPKLLPNQQPPQQPASKPGSRTAVNIAVDEVNDGIEAIDNGLPKPIPSFTRAHFNTNWITNDIYTPTPRQRYTTSQKPLFDLSRGDTFTGDDDLDNDDSLHTPATDTLTTEAVLNDNSQLRQHYQNDDSLIHTFYSPNQPRAIVDDSRDPEKQAVSTIFLNCLKLRREFLFTPAFVDRRSFDLRETPEYNPQTDAKTITRPLFDTLTTTTSTTSLVSNDNDSMDGQHLAAPLEIPSTPQQHHHNYSSSIASPRGNYTLSNPTSTISSSNRAAGFAFPKSTKLVTTTTTTLNSDVFCHINQSLSAELINHPEHFVYGFVNGVTQIHRKDVIDIMKPMRQHASKRKQQYVPPALLYPHLFPKHQPQSTLSSHHQQHSHHPPLTLSQKKRLIKQQATYERQTKSEHEFDKRQTMLEFSHPGYVRDIYHIALHQQRTFHSQLLSSRPRSGDSVSSINHTHKDRNDTGNGTNCSQNVSFASPQSSPRSLNQHQSLSGPFQNPTSSKSPNPTTTTVTNSNSSIDTTPLRSAPSILSANSNQGDSAIPDHYDSNLNNLIHVPSWSDFCDALSYILRTATDGPCKSWSYNRLTMLETQKTLHSHLNQDLERAQSKCVPHRDFYNVRKVDNHIHHSACMNQKHFLRFIKRKLREPEAISVPVISRDGKDLTLVEVFQSLNLTAYDLSIDTLDMHANQTFHRFDKFNAKYSPINETRLREIFLKYQNKIRGLYLAEITKEVFEDLHINKYQYAEYRISIYGRDPSEWAALADWIIDYKLVSPNVRWMIQIPRLYSVYKKSGSISSFQDMLTNIFLPLFHVTLYPQSNPKLHQLLSLIVGFDTVDDESVRTRFFDKANPPPQKWVIDEDPHYCVFMYYLYANLRVLNHLRELVGLNTFSLRPHSGEAGEVENTACAFLTSKGINHGITLFRTPPIQYLYYLAQVGISVSPLSNNLLFLEYPKNPFPRFFHRGLNVTLSTDDPLMIHMTKEPLIEEYAIASQTWNLSHIDLCEIARNSVLQSDFEHPFKAHWLGNNYYKHTGTESNDIRATNVPDIRIQFRWEVLYREHLLLSSYANHSNTVDVSLIDPIF